MIVLSTQWYLLSATKAMLGANVQALFAEKQEKLLTYITVAALEILVVFQGTIVFLYSLQQTLRTHFHLSIFLRDWENLGAQISTNIIVMYLLKIAILASMVGIMLESLDFHDT
mmetsp:Transcript_17429/g.56542  ORF Transcript_17429/g.56542 Transcript_17429/m.56542 type:complete len:114 (-) Transcript_17429:191-532(-)|eukprot:CAMPEP_0118915904 /NCGR_PEP_ID=MMETSP1166-20130328/16017_1 /TAXON_ID=1104430 /ORGANISM="Chrysoreinhardia sp, Strain CCMP3193" /LENGTH=113 /DNA_ID=CAMNT_0006855673 /DNA_START=77 /DNA_END=418 /DNA_ORIENTATION=+